MILSVDHCQHYCNILISKQILLLLLLHCNLILVTPNSRDMSHGPLSRANTLLSTLTWILGIAIIHVEHQDLITVTHVNDTKG